MWAVCGPVNAIDVIISHFTPLTLGRRLGRRSRFSDKQEISLYFTTRTPQKSEISRRMNFGSQGNELWKVRSLFSSFGSFEERRKQDGNFLQSVFDCLSFGQISDLRRNRRNEETKGNFIFLHFFRWESRWIFWGSNFRM